VSIFAFWVWLNPSSSLVNCSRFCCSVGIDTQTHRKVSDYSEDEVGLLFKDAESSVLGLEDT